MKTFLHHFENFYFVFLLLFFSVNVNSQCVVTGNVNTSSMVCSSYSGCTSINIGNGSTVTSLNFNTDLDLTCLGAIQFVIKNNASVNFGSSDRLYLGSGSSIIVEAGGDLSGSSCNASERIYIGGVLYASCNGGGGATTTFSDIELFGGSGSTTTNSPVCIGNAINLSATPPPNGSPFTYAWYDNSNNLIGTTQNISITAATSGTKSYQVQMFSSSLNKTMILNCDVVVNSGATTAAPTVSLVQPTCSVATGTITISAPIGSGMKYSINGLTYTNTTGIFTSVAAGTYSVTAKNSSGCVSSTTSVTLSATNTWTTSWSNGTPTSDQMLVFSGNYPPAPDPNVDLTGCSCTVSNGANVTIKTGKTLAITNGLTVLGSGSLTFEDTASLVQINTSSNSGNIKYKRLTTVIRNTDYTYWSSPVGGFTLGGVSPNTPAGKFYSFDSTIDDWKQESATTAMVSGIGYIIRGPQTSTYLPPNPPSLYQATFTGVPNNGHYEITGVIADRSYLLGNPYPSALDADTFLDANQNVLDGTLYFWTHNTPIAIGAPNPGSGLYAYSGDDYASYNRTGGTATAAAPSASTGGLNINIPSGKIASGQGFFGSSKVTPVGTTIVFDNSMRVGVGGISGNNSQFFKTKNAKTKTAVTLEKHRIWLDLTNDQGAFKQTLIGYVTNATNDYESRFDGESYDGNNFLDFYSVNKDKNLTIQGRALPFDENDEVPLGFRIALGGTFTIKIGQTDGVLSNESVFLEDKLTQTVINLKTEDYTFNTAAGVFDDRFVLRYRDKTLGIDQTKVNEGIDVLYSNNYKTVIIRNNLKDATVNLVSLFNMLGQKIAYWDVKDREQTSIQIPIKNLSSEIYVVKVKTSKGEFSKKIIIR